MTVPPFVERPAVFLDFDGTLVDIAPEPDAIIVAPELVPLLGRLAGGLEGALALISGRPVGDLDRFLAPFAPTAFGLHGLERRPGPGGPIERAPRSPALDRLRTRLLVSRLLTDGVTMEDKGSTIAVHYRAAPERGLVLAHQLKRMVAELSDLHLVEGKMVIEAKPRIGDKGTAVADLLSLAPFAGRRPVFLGDDVTDEDAFRAVLAGGGVAVKVGQGESLAPYRLPDVAAVHAWLGGLAASLGTAEDDGQGLQGAGR